MVGFAVELVAAPVVGFAVELVVALVVALVVERKDESVGESADEVRVSPAAEMKERRMYRFPWTVPPQPLSPIHLPKPHLQIAE